MDFQTYAKTIPPIKFGIKKIVLKIVEPFTLLVSANAKVKAHTFINITATTAKIVVKLKAVKNVLSLKARI